MSKKDYDVPKFGFEDKIFKDVEVIEVVDGDTLKCVIDVGGGVFGRKVWVPVRLVEIDAPEMKGDTAIEKVCAMVSLLTLVEKIFKVEPNNHLFEDYFKTLEKICNPSCSSEQEEENFEKKNDEIVEMNKKFKNNLNNNIHQKEWEPKKSLTLKTFGSDLYGRVLGKLYYQSDECEDVNNVDEKTINQHLCEEGVARYFKGNKARGKWCKDELLNIFKASQTKLN